MTYPFWRSLPGDTARASLNKQNLHSRAQGGHVGEGLPTPWPRLPRQGGQLLLLLVYLIPLLSSRLMHWLPEGLCCLYTCQSLAAETRVWAYMRTWGRYLQHEVSRTTCPASPEGLNAVRLQGRPFSSFNYKHLLHSKLFFFQVY